MSKAAVIVESPAKAKTISKFLGEQYRILSSMGHLVDLPEARLGVDLKHQFEPEYQVIPKRKKILAELKQEIEHVHELFLATDPDREGEAISWHLKNLLGDKKVVRRVSFHEITPQAVKEAFQHPRDLDVNLVNAQQARRILDRLVGYTLSPLLWKKVSRGLSAGRVQSVALRLIVERERDIQKFVQEEYWEIEAEFGKGKREEALFKAKLEKFKGEALKIPNQQEADRHCEAIKQHTFRVASVKEQEKRRHAPPPFITSTLQQDAFNKLRFSAERTMRIAQQLYEGLELGEEGSIGLITYMRTDSVNLAQSAIQEVRKFISSHYARTYLPAQPVHYKVKKTAQAAHEAIRPTNVTRTPEAVKPHLAPDQFKLYQLIWNRFVACQMAPAVFKVMTVEVAGGLPATLASGQAGDYLFKAVGSRLLFDGYLTLYRDEEEEEQDLTLPPLVQGEAVDLQNLEPSQHFTKPPPRYSDASLVKALEQRGIGRPSTYAPIIQTIVGRRYVKRESGYFHPSELGMVVTELLIKHFPVVLDFKFTAQMEEQLDKIEEGEEQWVKVVEDFYKPFSSTLETAKVEMKEVRKEVEQTSERCEKCGRPMVIKWGRHGKFLSCSGFPKCRNARSIGSGVKCPQADCGGELVERRSRRGMFYGCSKYPACRYTANKLPTNSQEPATGDT